MKIKTKLTLAFVLISLISLSVTSIPAYWIAKQALTEEVSNHLQSVATIQEHRLTAMIAQNLERLKLVASRTQLRLSLANYINSHQSEEQERMNRILQDAILGVSDFRSISLLTEDGKVVASTQEASLETEHSDKEFFVRGLRESSADIFFLDDQQKLGVYLSGPLYLDDNLLGVIVIESEVHNIIDLVSDYSGLGETGETFLAKRDADGNALFLAPLRFDKQAALSRTIKKESPNHPITQALLKNELQFTKSVDYRGELVLATTRYIEQTEWGLVVKIDEAEALAPVLQMGNLLGLVIFISSSAVIMISFYIAGTITRPIVNLTSVASQISAGKLSQRAQNDRTDEIGLLAQAFNRMAATLIEDIAARSQAEAALELKAQELARSVASLEEFAYVVSHDLRAPLRAMKNYSLFLQEDYMHLLDEFGLEYIEGIAESAQHMDDLVVDLLEYSRIGRIQVELEPVDINDLVERVVTSLDLRREAEIRLAPDAPIVQAYPVRLEQIFANLLGNAVKFRRPDVSPVISISWQEKNDAWFFSVDDNGIGISEQYSDKIFGIFQRLHTQEEYEGTGVGLAIVKKAVSEHGGEIWLQSQLGQGSTFTFTLPKKAKGKK